MSGLGQFHHTEEAPSKESRIVAWVVIALLLGAAALFVVETGVLNSGPVPAGQSYPRGL
jgi:hypothetical protein